MREKKVPAVGTMAAVDYWAVRSRASMQVARTIVHGLSQADPAEAIDWATTAAGEAAEFEGAVRDYLEAQS